MKLMLALMFAAVSARADGLADLRAALTRFPAQSPVRAAVTFEKHQEDNDHATPEHGKAAVEADTGAEGLRVVYPNDVVARAQAESRAQEADPEKATPTASALRDLRALDLVASLDGASAPAKPLPVHVVRDRPGGNVAEAEAIRALRSYIAARGTPAEDRKCVV